MIVGVQKMESSYTPKWIVLYMTESKYNDQKLS